MATNVLDLIKQVQEQQEKSAEAETQEESRIEEGVSYLMKITGVREVAGKQSNKGTSLGYILTQQVNLNRDAAGGKDEPSEWLPGETETVSDYQFAYHFREENGVRVPQFRIDQNGEVQGAFGWGLLGKWGLIAKAGVDDPNDLEGAYFVVQYEWDDHEKYGGWKINKLYEARDDMGEYLHGGDDPDELPI